MNLNILKARAILLQLRRRKKLIRNIRKIKIEKGKKKEKEKRIGIRIKIREGINQSIEQIGILLQRKLKSIDRLKQK